MGGQRKGICPAHLHHPPGCTSSPPLHLISLSHVTPSFHLFVTSALLLVSALFVVPPCYPPPYCYHLQPPPLYFCPALPLCFSPPSLFQPSSSSSMFMVESLSFMGIYFLALCSKPHCSWLNHCCHVHPPDLLYLGLICQFWAASSHPH